MVKTQKLSYKKIIKELNWKQDTNMKIGLNSTIDWYTKLSIFI